jgi:hypothetical protein
MNMMMMAMLGGNRQMQYRPTAPDTNSIEHLLYEAQQRRAMADIEVQELTAAKQRSSSSSSSGSGSSNNNNSSSSSSSSSGSGSGSGTPCGTLLTPKINMYRTLAIAIRLILT